MNFQTDNPLIFGFQIGTLWGARVRVSPLLFLVVWWLAGLLGWKVGLLAFAIYAVSTLLHEYGHVFAARLTGGDADEVILWPLGGLALCRRAPTFQSEFLTPTAGPLVNLALCVILLPWIVPSAQFWTLVHPIYLPEIELSRGLGQAVILLTFSLNWKLLLLNLLPMLPLDGASMWHAVARHRWEPIVAKTAMLVVSTLTHFALAIVAMSAKNTYGFSLLFLSYVLLPLTILEWIRLQAANLLGVEMEDSENYESYGENDDEEGQPRRTRTPGLFERWKLERERKRQEKEELERVETEARLDALLEKVHQTGIDSLTEAEKRFLKKASARYRGQNRP